MSKSVPANQAWMPEYITGDRLAGVFFLVIGGVPIRPEFVPFLGTSPDGLALIHMAPSVPEREMLADLLRQEGFRVEYVPASTAMWGLFGTTQIHVPIEEAGAAARFLDGYLAGAAADETRP